MRARVTLLVVAILLVAGFAAMNWSEILRTAPLSFGVFVTDAPIGLILLGLLLLSLVAFLALGAMHRTQTLIESRHHLKELQHHRDLADRAEASRFTELRTHLDTSLRELRQRDAIAATEFEKAMVLGQRELRTQLDQMSRTLASRLTDMEHRIDGRLGSPSAARPTLPEAVHSAETARDERLLAERAREERVAAETLASSEPPKRRFWNL
jgi:hypothetical protein